MTSIDPSFVAGAATTATGSAALSLGGFVSAAGSFSLTKTASLLSLELDSVSVFVGVGGSVDTTSTDATQWSVTNGSIGFAGTATKILVGLAAGDTAVRVVDLDASVVGITGVTFKVGKLNATVAPATTSMTSIDPSFVAGAATTATGSAALSLGGFVSAAGSFSLTKTARPLSLQLHNVSLFVGGGGPGGTTST